MLKLSSKNAFASPLSVRLIPASVASRLLIAVLVLMVAACGKDLTYKETFQTDIDEKNDKVHLRCGKNAMTDARACQMAFLGKGFSKPNFWGLNRVTRPSLIADVVQSSGSASTSVHLYCFEDDFVSTSGAVRIDGGEPITMRAKGAILSFIDSDVPTERLFAPGITFAYEADCDGEKMTDEIRIDYYRVADFYKKALEYVSPGATAVFAEKNAKATDGESSQSDNLRSTAANRSVTFGGYEQILSPDESDIICKNTLVDDESINRYLLQMKTAYVMANNSKPYSLEQLDSFFTLGPYSKELLVMEYGSSHSHSASIANGNVIVDQMLLVMLRNASLEVDSSGGMSLTLLLANTDECARRCRRTSKLSCGETSFGYLRVTSRLASW